MTEFDKDAKRHWDECWPALQAFADAFNEQRRRHPTAPALPEVQPLLDIVAAKREAERPKLMTAEEAMAMYDDLMNVGHIPWRSGAAQAWQAVLTEERKRTLKVIEGIAANPNAGSDRAILGDRAFVAVEAVTRALTDRS